MSDPEELEPGVPGIAHKIDTLSVTPPRLKRHRSASPSSNKRPRPIPPLQSILAQTLGTSTPSSRQIQGDNTPISLSELSLQQTSSPPSTLAKLLAQSPSSTLTSSHSCSLDAESYNTESDASKQDESGNTSTVVSGSIL